MDASAHPAAPPVALPEGFVPLDAGGPFIAHNGPLNVLHQGTLVKFGFRVERRHSNPMGNLHGGMMASFCDMLLPLSVHRQNAEVADRFLPTISLQVDYMGAAPLGAWVQGEGQVLRTTRNMLFGQALVTANGEPALRVSGVFKRGPLINDGDAKDPLGVLNIL